MVIRSSDPLGIKVWIILPLKPTRPAKMITEDVRNLEWIQGKGENAHVGASKPMAVFISLTFLF